MNLIEHIGGLFSAKMSLIKEIFSLIILEAQLAKLNVFPLIVYLIITLPLLVTLWVSAMILLGYMFFTFINNQLVISLMVIFLLNATLLTFSIIKIKKTFQFLCFTKTRKALIN
jgi:hypothetical protein